MFSEYQMKMLRITDIYGRAHLVAPNAIVCLTESHAAGEVMTTALLTGGHTIKLSGPITEVAQHLRLMEMQTKEN